VYIRVSERALRACVCVCVCVCVFSTPAPAYYNDDDVPDFLVHWQYGPGFPVYYHSVVRVSALYNAAIAYLLCITVFSLALLENRDFFYVSS